MEAMSPFEGKKMSAALFSASHFYALSNRSLLNTTIRWLQIFLKINYMDTAVSSRWFLAL